MNMGFVKRFGYKVVRFGEKFDRNSSLTLSGDRDLEWSWVISKAPNSTKRTLDFGPGNSTIPIALSFISEEVVCLDLNKPEINYGVKNIKHILGDVTSPPAGLGKFDLIVNCSSIEHVGLPGRYGSTEISDGDLIGMENLHHLMNESAKMLLTVPVGKDGVYLPNHRVYGIDRLPQLLSGFKIENEKYFEKTNSKRFWAETTKEIALATNSSATFYSIGLFVLAKK